MKSKNFSTLKVSVVFFGSFYGMHNPFISELVEEGANLLERTDQLAEISRIIAKNQNVENHDSKLSELFPDYNQKKSYYEYIMPYYNADIAKILTIKKVLEQTTNSMPIYNTSYEEQVLFPMQFQECSADRILNYQYNATLKLMLEYCNKEENNSCRLNSYKIRLTKTALQNYCETTFYFTSGVYYLSLATKELEKIRRSKNLKNSIQFLQNSNTIIEIWQRTTGFLETVNYAAYPKSKLYLCFSQKDIEAIENTFEEFIYECKKFSDPEQFMNTEDPDINQSTEDCQEVLQLCRKYAVQNLNRLQIIEQCFLKQRSNFAKEINFNMILVEDMQLERYMSPLSTPWNIIGLRDCVPSAKNNPSRYHANFLETLTKLAISSQELNDRNNQAEQIPKFDNKNIKLFHEYKDVFESLCLDYCEAQCDRYLLDNPYSEHENIEEVIYRDWKKVNGCQDLNGYKEMNKCRGQNHYYRRHYLFNEICFLNIKNSELYMDRWAWSFLGDDFEKTPNKNRHLQTLNSLVLDMTQQWMDIIQHSKEIAVDIYPILKVRSLMERYAEKVYPIHYLWEYMKHFANLAAVCAQSKCRDQTHIYHVGNIYNYILDFGSDSEVQQQGDDPGQPKEDYRDNNIISSEGPGPAFNTLLNVISQFEFYCDKILDNMKRDEIIPIYYTYCFYYSMADRFTNYLRVIMRRMHCFLKAKKYPAYRQMPWDVKSGPEMPRVTSLEERKIQDLVFSTINRIEGIYASILKIDYKMCYKKTINTEKNKDMHDTFCKFIYKVRTHDKADNNNQTSEACGFEPSAESASDLVAFQQIPQAKNNILVLENNNQGIKSFNLESQSVPLSSLQNNSWAMGGTGFFSSNTNQNVAQSFTSNLATQPQIIYSNNNYMPLYQNTVIQGQNNPYSTVPTGFFSSNTNQNVNQSFTINLATQPQIIYSNNNYMPLYQNTVIQGQNNPYSTVPTGFFSSNTNQNVNQSFTTNLATQPQIIYSNNNYMPLYQNTVIQGQNNPYSTIPTGFFSSNINQNVNQSFTTNLATQPQIIYSNDYRPLEQNIGFQGQNNAYSTIPKIIPSNNMNQNPNNASAGYDINMK